MLKKFTYSIIILTVLSSLQACTTSRMSNIDHSQPLVIAADKNIAVVPFYNTTSEAQASARSAIITASILRTKNINVANMPANDHKKMQHDWYKNMLLCCEWAKNHNVSYLMKGSVNEWGYIHGSKGEVAVVAFSMQLRDTSNCQVVWNAVGSKTGGHDMSVSGAAQKLLDRMLDSVSAGSKSY